MVHESDRQIAEEVARAAGLSVAGLGLRFDRVALRVLGRLRLFAERAAPAGATVLVAITAPIRLPAKTAAALEREIGALVSARGAPRRRGVTLCGNAVQVRLAAHSPLRAHRLIGFVHNPDVAAAQLLDLAEAWLRGDNEI